MASGRARRRSAVLCLQLAAQPPRRRWGRARLASLPPPATQPQRAVKRPPEGRRGGDTFGGIFPSAMETNDLGFVASLLFVLVPAVFLIILYIQTNSRQGS